MANHVHTVVTFHRINDDGKKVLEELYSRVRKDQDYEWLSDIFVDGKEGSPTYEETGKYTFTLENIGPKWCYIEEFDGEQIIMTSAWSWPSIGMEWVFEKVAEVDPDFIAYVTYEDEMPNFVGACVYDKNGLVDEYEDEFDDIQQIVINSTEGLIDEWDADAEEFTDEGNDIFYENLWEVISDMQMKKIHEILEDMDALEAA
jgi:hypothetical protein